MNFDLTEDEQMLKAVAERFVADRYDLDRRRAYLDHPQGFCADNWALLADVGLIAAPFSEAHGGLNASQTDIALIADALGRGLVVEPWIECVLVAGGLFVSAAPPSLHEHWVEGVVAGKLRLALAHREKDGRGNRQPVTTTATKNANGWRINGSKSLVVAGVGADGLIVSAREPNTGEIGLFLVPADASGLAELPYRLVDGSTACALELRDVVVPNDYRLQATLKTLNEIETRAAIARCAEAVGIMQMMFDTTRDHLRTRKQFGAPLSSFQALQHRMVAQYAVIEQARALLDLAVMTESAENAQWHRAIAGARAFISETSVPFGHEMIQMHGGMGVADELVIGHGHKRLVMLSRYPETAAVALDTYAGIAV